MLFSIIKILWRLLQNPAEWSTSTCCLGDSDIKASLKQAFFFKLSLDCYITWSETSTVSLSHHTFRKSKGSYIGNCSLLSSGNHISNNKHNKH